MTQSQLDRAVARVTGESVLTIRNHGFTLLETPSPSGKPRSPRRLRPRFRRHHQREHNRDPQEASGS